MVKGVKVLNDGTIATSLGKKLLKTLRLDLTQSINKQVYYIECKELTFAILDSPIYLYIDKNDDDHKLTISDQMSLEANIEYFYITVPEGSTGTAEIWIWE